MSDDRLKFKLRTQLYKVDHGLGPGVVKIMDLVNETGSLTKAYKIMNLSSSKGWKMLKRTEEDLGFPIIESQVGGSGGGKSRVSEQGQALLDKYREFDTRLRDTSQLLFDEIFEDYI